MLLAEPVFGKKRAEPFGQRASAHVHVHVHVHVHAHTLASQGGLRSLLRTIGPALMEVASVEDSIQSQYGRPACDAPRSGNSSQPQTRRLVDYLPRRGPQRPRGAEIPLRAMGGRPVREHCRAECAHRSTQNQSLPAPEGNGPAARPHQTQDGRRQALINGKAD